jgi:hypothetical protein
VSAPQEEYNREVLRRAQQFGCSLAEATVWSLIAARRRVSEDEAEALDDAIRDYVAARERGESDLDDLSTLLADERGD